MFTSERFEQFPPLAHPSCANIVFVIVCVFYKLKVVCIYIVNND